VACSTTEASALEATLHRLDAVADACERLPATLPGMNPPTRRFGVRGSTVQESSARRRLRTVATLALAAALLSLGGVAPDVARADDPAGRGSVGAGWQPPVPGDVVRPVDLPSRPWLSGHRGVDLAASAGAAVVAPSAGTVTFAGQVAGRPVLVVSHGALRSTLEPVDAVLPPGSVVAAGDQVGVVSSTAPGHCDPATCLHWGVRRGEQYLDPLALLGRAEPIVLLSTG
jgi:murein DD-endopeptidase MepM/ murein hydrolase activator NlpD